MEGEGPVKGSSNNQSNSMIDPGNELDMWARTRVIIMQVSQMNRRDSLINELITFWEIQNRQENKIWGDEIFIGLYFYGLPKLLP